MQPSARRPTRRRRPRRRPWRPTGRTVWSRPPLRKPRSLRRCGSRTPRSLQSTGQRSRRKTRSSRPGRLSLPKQKPKPNHRSSQRRPRSRPRCAPLNGLHLRSTLSERGNARQPVLPLAKRSRETRGTRCASRQRRSPRRPTSVQSSPRPPVPTSDPERRLLRRVHPSTSKSGPQGKRRPGRPCALRRRRLRRSRSAKTPRRSRSQRRRR